MCVYDLDQQGGCSTWLVRRSPYGGESDIGGGGDALYTHRKNISNFYAFLTYVFLCMCTLNKCTTIDSCCVFSHRLF